MKALLLTFALLLTLPTAAQTPPEAQPARASGEAVPDSAASAIENPALRAELLDMFAADQEVRERMIAEGSAAPSPEIIAEAIELGRVHLARVLDVVEAHGWPGAALVGRDASVGAFFIIQHGDVAEQKQMLPLVEAAWHAGDLDGSHYAMLYDRVRAMQGELQVYGTQATFGDGNEVIVLPLADPETVDARRAEVGLMPLAEYLVVLKRAYFPETTE